MQAAVWEALSRTLGLTAKAGDKLEAANLL